jgi:hypothetical protein
VLSSGEILEGIDLYGLTARATYQSNGSEAIIKKGYFSYKTTFLL